MIIKFALILNIMKFNCKTKIKILKIDLKVNNMKRIYKPAV